LIFRVYWPNPPTTVQIAGDGQTLTTGGRYWCLTEYMPGEFNKKWKPRIDRVSGNAQPNRSETFYGNGGAALLFDPSADVAAIDPTPKPGPWHP
jgi:hypothetical protein